MYYNNYKRSLPFLQVKEKSDLLTGTHANNWKLLGNIKYLYFKTFMMRLFPKKKKIFMQCHILFHSLKYVPQPNLCKYSYNWPYAHKLFQYWLSVTLPFKNIICLLLSLAFNICKYFEQYFFSKCYFFLFYKMLKYCFT